MMQIFSLPTSPAALARNTRWISAIILGVVLILAGVTGGVGLRQQGVLLPAFWQTLVMLSFAAGAVGLAWAGHDRPAAWLLICGAALTSVLGSLLQRDIGAASALVVVVGMNSLALVLLSAQQSGLVLMPSFGVGAVAVLVDIFGSANRPALIFPAARYVVLGLVLALYLAILAHNFRALPWRNKLLLSATALVALATVTVVVITNQIARQALLAATGEHQHDLATAQGRAIGLYLTERVQALRNGLALSKFLRDTLAAQNAAYPARPWEALAQQETAWQGGAQTAPLVAERLNNELAGELRELQNHAPDYLTLLVTDRYGGVQATLLPPPPRYEQTETLWWSAVAQGQVYIGPPTHFAAWDIEGVEIAVPILTHNGAALEGVLYAVIDLQGLAQLSLNQPTYHEVYANHLFLPPDQELVLTATPGEQVEPNAAVLTQLLLPQAPAYVIGPDARIYSLGLVAFEPMPEGAPLSAMSWYVVVSTDLAQAVAPAEAAARTATLVALGVLVTAVLVALAFARSLLRPLRGLTQAAQQVQAGNLQAQALVNSPDEVGVLAETFNAMTTRLRHLILEAEQLAAGRTEALNQVAAISTRLADIADEAQLAAETVSQIQAAFAYECVLVLWATGEELRVAAGTAPIGPQLLAEGYRQPFGQGAIGQAAARNQPVLVTDTTNHPDWQPHPLRPTTQAEIAVPIALGEQVLGVLDVQQSAQTLGHADVVVLKTIASLVAVSLQNARQLTQARALAERETQARALTQAIQNTTTVEAALQVAARELGRLTGRSTYVQLHAPNEEKTG